MLVNIIHRSSISKEIVTRFAHILSNSCSCIIRIIDEADVNTIISQSYIDELIDVHHADNITLEGVENIYPNLPDNGYIFSDYYGDTYSINTVIGIGFPEDVSDDILLDISTRYLSQLISHVEHNWYKNEKGWWSRTYSDQHLCHLNKNGLSKIYYIDDNHYMQTGWQTVDVDGYHLRLYFDLDCGELKTGWQLIDNIWYYFHKDFPHVFSGSVTIDGKVYQISSEGILIGYNSDTKPSEDPKLN